MKLFSSAYTDTLAGLAASNFATDKGRDGVLKGLRALAQPTGFVKGKRSSLDDLRKRITADSKGGKECDGFIVGAGKWGANGAVVDDASAQKLGALKLLRHTYSITNWGSHKVWIVSTPTAMREWPADAYSGKQILTVKNSLSDLSEQFSKGKGIEIIKRWFADDDNQTEAKLGSSRQRSMTASRSWQWAPLCQYDLPHPPPRDQ